MKVHEFDAGQIFENDEHFEEFLDRICEIADLIRVNKDLLPISRQLFLMKFLRLVMEYEMSFDKAKKLADQLTPEGFKATEQFFLEFAEHCMDFDFIAAMMKKY